MLSQRSLGAGYKKALPSDDEFNRVSFMSHFDGANNGVNNAFDDGSASNHTITANGNVTQGSFGPFARPDGEWGVTFDGASDYLDANDGPTFGSGAFTIELFVNLRTLGSVQVFFDARPNSTNGLYPMLFVNSNNTLNYYVSSGARITSSETLSANRWYHVAVSRTSTSTKMFLDGTQVGSTYSDSNNYPDSGRMRVGTSSYSVGDGFHVNGVISNVRVVNSALYTSNFTAPTGKLTAVTNTKLLTCQSNRFVDNSADGLTMTPSGDTAVTAFGPFLTTSVYDPAVNAASAYFDGTGDYLTAAASADFQLGTGDLTVEFWAYNTDAGASNNFLDNRANANGFALQRNASNQFNVYFEPSSTSVFTSGFVPQNAWIHFCWTRASGVNKFFIDGAQSGSNVSDASDFNSNSLNIGAKADGSQEVTGYMCDVRIIKGTAVEPSAIPTAPLTAITNTKLLLNMADGQAIDSAAQTNLNFKGTGKLSTGQAKFGDTSLFMDGNSDGVYISAAPISTIWTVEQWIYPTRFYSGSGNYDRIWADGTANSDSLACVLWGASGGDQGKIRLYNDDSLVVGTSTAVSLNTWTHLAIVSSGSTTKIFLDGTERGTTNSASNLKGRKFTIGYMGTSGYFGGYIDEFRTSLMARYTSNFTAPAEPFADKGE